ncbi:MAG: amidohydrolase family protein [Pyrinomonadaceae bacterium]
MKTKRPFRFGFTHVHSVIIFIAAALSVSAQIVGPQPGHGKTFQTIVIRGAMIVDGNGKPASGPYDIVIADGKIKQIAGFDPLAAKAGRARRPPKGDFEIDATGKYVLPGLINLHGHTQDERAGKPMPVEYCTKLWLASGITTVRDLGANAKTLEWATRSAANELMAPNIIPYGVFNDARSSDSVTAAIERVRRIKSDGYSGIKLFGVDRDIMRAMMEEAHKQGLRVAHHSAVEETNAWDDADFGMTSIEHWYGIPEAAMTKRRQSYPSDYNYNDEVDRFRYAGRIWRETDPALLDSVLKRMIEKGVAWDPTLSIYEASRDLQKAQTQPFFDEYLHPVLEEFFRPNPSNHGSYFLGWTSTDEVYWKENFRIWMKAVKRFEELGGVVGTGEDAGFIYRVYGFGLIRELELHQEAGFDTLSVIRHATGNAAKILGMEDTKGRIRIGFDADLIVVNGNPLEDLKVLYPTGTDGVNDGKVVRTGGVEWTLKGGIPFHGPTLSAEVRDIVSKAKAEGAKR